MFDSVGKAFALSLKAIKIFCVIVGFNIAMNIANVVILPAPAGAEMNIAKSLTAIVAGLLFFVLAAFLQGGIIAYVRDLVKSGSAGLAPFIGNCSKYFVRMLGVVLLTMLIILGCGAAFFGILPIIFPAAKIALFIAGIIVLIVFMILLILPGYVLVADDLGTLAAFRKGVAVSMANFLKMLAILIVLIIVGIAVMLLASFITGLLSLFFKQIVSYIVAIVMAISSGIVTLLADIAYMDFYLKKAQIK